MIKRRTKKVLTRQTRSVFRVTLSHTGLNETHGRWLGEVSVPYHRGKSVRITLLDWSQTAVLFQDFFMAKYGSVGASKAPVLVAVTLLWTVCVSMHFWTLGQRFWWQFGDCEPDNRTELHLTLKFSSFDPHYQNSDFCVLKAAFAPKLFFIWYLIHVAYSLKLIAQSKKKLALALMKDQA